MRKYSLAFPVVTGLLLLAVAGSGQPVASPTILLEATSTIRGVRNWHSTSLFVRLTDDGKVEWDKATSQNWQRRIGSVNAAELLHLKRTLDSVDNGTLRDKMGPYFVYVDTSVELRIRVVQHGEKFTFSVINPWSFRNTNTSMPSDVKTLVCEIDEVRSEVAGEELDDLCKTGSPPH